MSKRYSNIIKIRLFSFQMLALLAKNPYFCTVFHGIRFKVSKRLVVGRQSIFLYLLLSFLSVQDLPYDF